MTRNYFYDNGIVAFTTDGNTLSSANLLDDSGDVIGSYRGDTYHVYLEDAQGSTYSIVKQDGNLSAAYSYSDFGETNEITGSSFDNEICYTGAVYDDETGLYYLNARYYNPVNGRFISQDSYRGSVDNPGQWHLYAYCANNPINYTDPSGHYYHNDPGDKPRAGQKKWNEVEIEEKGLQRLKAYYNANKEENFFFNLLCELFDFGAYGLLILDIMENTKKSVQVA